MASGVQFNHIPDVITRMNKAASQLVRKGGFDVEAQAKRIAARDTGFMANSIYTVTSDSSTNKRPVPKHQGSFLFPDVGRTNSPMRAMVLVGANYGLYVEMGTGHMRAQPFMRPAADLVRPKYLEGWRKLEEMLR